MLNVDLTGKIALVTGGTSQLGRVIVRTLADCGASVAIHYHSSAERAAALREELLGKDQQAMIVQADITVEADVQRMRDEVVAGLGAPDIIVNNAVIQYKWTHVLQQAPDDYRSQFESCVLHNVLMAQAFVPAMIEKGWGRVIGINTECAMQCTPNQSAYISGKRGMDGVMRVLAKEVGEHNITVNQVAPGWTISEDRQDDEGPAYEAYKANVPLKKRGVPQNIANAVAFLASDLASYITGVYLPVCGGNVMPRI